MKRVLASSDVVINGLFIYMPTDMMKNVVNLNKVNK